MANKALKNEIKAFGIIGSALVVLVVSSTIFFHIVEKWHWFDAYYYTVVTVATVGYGDLAPQTHLGKLAATILIFFGIGLFATFASMMIKQRPLQRIVVQRQALKNLRRRKK